MFSQKMDQCYVRCGLCALHCDARKLTDVVASDMTRPVGSGTELLLNSLSLSDSGTYVCTANNSQGSVTAHAVVRVTGRLSSAHPVLSASS